MGMQLKQAIHGAENLLQRYTVGKYLQKVATWTP